MALFFGNQLVAQDNPCGVEGVVVEASNYEYSPAALEIEAGQTVVWVNVGGFHDVNGVESSIGENWNNPETFSTGAVTGNMEGVCIGTHTFTVEGTYDYDCSIGNHAANGMVATITVNPAQMNTTVVDIIVNSEDHTLLEAAVGAAGLDDALSAEGPFTVFAPTDDAFTALTEVLDVTVDELLAYPLLPAVLQYHVVGAEAYSTDLTDGQEIETLLGEDVTVSITTDGVFINNAQVIVADLAADNGVVHVINAVLLPPTTDVTELTSFELSIYPNPVHGGTFTVSGAWEAGASIEVFELTGRKVFETTSTQTTVAVSTDGWEAGTYAVRITDGARTATRLFLVD